jgi:phosphomannomutase/phosphoglucomutase
MSDSRLFGTSGIRGDAEKLFTNQFSFDLGRSFALFLYRHKQFGPVAIGIDPRASSPRIRSMVTNGLAYEGREVFDQGVCPVPAIHYCLLAAPFAGSIMVTGSHIASDLNGAKFFAFREEILKVHEAELETIYHGLANKTPYTKSEAVDTEDNTGREYEEMLVKLGTGLPKFKLVIDPGNGAQTGVMSRVLTRLGCDVIPLNDSLQADFMTRDTETEDSFREMQKLVLFAKADAGIGFDSDGDRVIFVDEKGRYIPGDYSCSIIARQATGGTIVTPINTSAVVEKIGKKVIRTKVGSPYVVESMKKHRANFGFEGNGGGIHAEIMLSRDGGSTLIKFLKILGRSGKSLSGLMSELPIFFISKSKINCPKKYNQKILSVIEKQYSDHQIERLDGLKIWLGDSAWILFRPSSNSEEFRVFAEAADSKKAASLVADGINSVKQIITS